MGARSVHGGAVTGSYVLATSRSRLDRGDRRGAQPQGLPPADGAGTARGGPYRPASGGGRRSRAQGTSGRRPLADPPAGRSPERPGPEARGRQGVASQAGVVARPPLVARPHGALGSFENLLLGVTRDPAMLMFLSGGDSTKWEPNENYARELMELFTLGAGRGYTESTTYASTPGRSPAGTTTGRTDPGPVNFRYNPRSTTVGPRRSSDAGAATTGSTRFGSA